MSLFNRLSGRIRVVYEVCPELLDLHDQVKVIMVQNHPQLPNDFYTIIDGYCADPHCDCRVAYLFVHGESHPDKILASITFGWEPLAFYVKWMGVTKADNMIRDLKGPALMPMAPQSKLARPLLELVAVSLQDPNYVRLLKRHYYRFKKVLRSNIK